MDKSSRRSNQWPLSSTTQEQQASSAPEMHDITSSLERGEQNPPPRKRTWKSTLATISTRIHTFFHRKSLKEKLLLVLFPITVFMLVLGVAIGAWFALHPNNGGQGHDAKVRSSVTTTNTTPTSFSTYSVVSTLISDITSISVTTQIEASTLVTVSTSLVVPSTAVSTSTVRKPLEQASGGTSTRTITSPRTHLLAATHSVTASTSM